MNAEQKIKSRIQFIQEECIFETSEPIEEKSLALFLEFIDFLLVCGNLIYPAISLTPNREIYACWTIEKKKYCFRFGADGKIRYITRCLELEAKDNE